MLKLFSELLFSELCRCRIETKNTLTYIRILYEKNIFDNITHIGTENGICRLSSLGSDLSI